MRLFGAAVALFLYQVAFALEWHVAVDGDDANTGTADAPFATLQRARDAVRTAQPLDEPAEILIHGGTYRLEQTLELTPQDSGTAEAPVTYRAFKRERVVLSGGRIIEGHIQERTTARKNYETARNEGRQAALVAQQRPNVFTTSIANIAPNGTLTVEIEYQ